jgi:hypothetical protein
MTRRPRTEGKEPVQFGATGLIFQSINVIFDAATETLWWPLRHQPIAGELVGQETQAPVRTWLTTWRAWKQLHPDTTVLAGTEEGLDIDYEKNPVLPRNYENVFDVLYPIYGFNLTETPLAPKAHVIGVHADGAAAARAYPCTLLQALPEAERMFQDKLGEKDITVTYDADANILEATDAEGNALPADAAYWIAWHGAYPKTTVWNEKEARRQMDMLRETEALHFQAQTPSAQSPGSEPETDDATGP